jgi:beta-phosphoglucomutase
MYTTEIDNYLRKFGFNEFTPKAVLFDMDGVLYDSMPNHAYSWHNSMASFGIEMSEADAYAHEGMRGVETIKKIVKEQRGIEISDEESQRMYDEKSRIFATRPQAKIMEGVIDLQRKIKSYGMKIVVVTGSGQHSLLEKLTHDFSGLIEPGMIVSSFDVTRGKPHPMPYLKGMEKAGVEPWEAIVVENAPLGVRAAVAALIFTVAVNTGPLPNEMLSEEGANLVFSRMTEFDKNFEYLIG